MAPARDIEEADFTIEDEPTRRPCFSRKKKIMIAMFNVMVVAVILGVFLSKSKTNVKSANQLNGSPYETSAAEGTPMDESVSAESSIPDGTTELSASESETESTNDIGSDEDSTNEAESDTSIPKKPVTDMTITVFDGILPAFVSSRADVSQLAREACDANEVLTTIDLVTDGYAWETSWEIKRPDGTQLAFGPPTGQKYERMTGYEGELCLPVGRNILVINDIEGDGLCCIYGDGKMKISVGSEILVETGDEDFKTKEYEFDVFSTGNTDVTTDSVSSTVSSSAVGSTTTFAMELANNITTVEPTTTDTATTTDSGMAGTDATTAALTSDTASTAAAGTTDVATTAAGTTDVATTEAVGTGSTTSSFFNTVSAFTTVASTVGVSMGSTSAAADSTTVAMGSTSAAGGSTLEAVDTTASSASGSGEYCITVEVMTDNYGKSETAYAFSSKPSNNAEDPVVYFAQAVGDLENDQLYEDTVCVPAGTYELYVEDSFRGMCCSGGQGYYSVKVDGVEVLYGGNYITFGGSNVSHDIVVGQDLVLSDRDTEWLVAHNTRREEFHTSEGTEYRPLVWSAALAEDADNWLDEILSDCTTHKEPNLAEGENLSFRKVGSERDTEFPDNILKRWVDIKADKDYPTNNSFTQAMWRATRYVGCSDRSRTLSDGQICYASICRYARAGNCAMGKYDDWKIPTLADRTPCGPVCPDDGCR